MNARAKKPHVLFRVATLAASLALAGPGAAERTYKWVDSDGNVHYSNRLPPETSQIERKELNDQGRIVKVYSAPLTAEEKIEQQRLEDIARRRQERAEKRAIHDRSLLATYSSVADMEKARNSKIELVESLIKLTKSRIRSMQDRLLSLSEEAARFERSGRKLPFRLQSQIQNIRDQIVHNKDFVRDKEEETEQIKLQFASDIARYQALTSDKKAAKEKAPSPLELARKNPNVKLTRHDRTLLTTFSSIEDLVFARNQEIENINFEIRQAYERIDTMQGHLAELSNNADEYEADGEALPGSLIDQMKQVMSEIGETEQELHNQRTQKQRITDQFERDIKRFKLLTASN